MEEILAPVDMPGDTVDGGNPSPVDMVNIPLFSGFHTSLVVQDFLHQQYGKYIPIFIYNFSYMSGGFLIAGICPAFKGCNSGK